ncbi:MAG TPA: NAD(P)(+) transhydrogenase (Re/Si-specific) subunit beta, partial [Bacteroidales bacterium]|nr:NAD(P)(+) transhydrogenase (Re/Si-specific) subunit beta [Bacteroidales bacterium]
YAGVDNPLYNRNEGVYMLLGDAKDSLNDLLNRLN